MALFIDNSISLITGFGLVAFASYNWGAATKASTRLGHGNTNVTSDPRALVIAPLV